MTPPPYEGSDPSRRRLRDLPAMIALIALSAFFAVVEVLLILKIGGG
ncbi:MAG: hypothetical protein ACXVEI_09765 [Actinomycetota bacterium]